MVKNSAAGATAPNTPPHSVNSAPEKLKSTPLARGSAAISEHISTVGVGVEDVRQWIARDVDDYREAGADAMLQELLCGFEDRSSSLKSKLLKDSLQAVLPICNKKNITDYLAAFANCTVETQSYKPFVQFANAGLIELSSVQVTGLAAAPHDDDDGILFHHNDKNMNQLHQGATSVRKPDVVLVSWKNAKGVAKNGGKAKGVTKKRGKAEKESYMMNQATEKPHGNFKWTAVRSTLEFKRKHGTLKQPNSPYTVTESPQPEYLSRLKDPKNPAEPTGSASGPLPAPAPARSLNKPSNEPTRESERLKAQQTDKKRTSDHLNSTEPASKRIKSDETRTEQKEPKKLHPNVQNGIYVAEMLAANIALQRVVSYVVNNDIIYIWYFDRHDTIQCAGINFIKDLPRFLVLLLAMQRMTPKQWGHHPLFKHEPGISCEVAVGNVDLKFDLKSDKRTTHYGLRGRATNVFPVQSKELLRQLREDQDRVSDIPTEELVAKLYWPEEARQSEEEILKTVHEIAKREPKVKGHVPEMVWCHKFEETSTAKIRSSLGLKTEGKRALYIIVFKKLSPITELSGDDFLIAWWQVVVCHYALWEQGVRHRDVSPSNLMVYKTADGQWFGVLNDYDLSSIINTPTGNERTGTVPFMALELLTPAAIAGNVEHKYKHDAESLIWVLVWVCLRYKKGKLLSEGRPLDDWLTVDALGCHKEKSSFLLKLADEDCDIEASSSHEDNWDVALSCIDSVLSTRGVSSKRRRSKRASSRRAKAIVVLDNASVFKTWLEDNVLPLPSVHGEQST